MTQISVIIPCYNQGKYIAECLDSVLAQTYTDYEIIIVNDGSTDNSLEIIAPYLEKNKNIKLINQKNQGVVASRNNAIRQASGKYIYPLDADDKIGKTCLEKLYRKITTSDYRVVASEVCMFGMRTGYFRQPKFSKLEMYGKHECCVVSALFYKQDFTDFGGYKMDFNGYSGDDMDYWLNYVDRNYPMYRIPEYLFFYRIKENRQSVWNNFSAEEFKKRHQIKEKMLLKYHPKMKPWIFYYKILHSKFIRLFLHIKFFKKHLYIKIFGIPIYKKKIEIKEVL